MKHPRILVDLRHPGSSPGHLDLIPGRRPYLWIGDAKERCVGTINGNGTLRRLRDALTKAIRRGAR